MQLELNRIQENPTLPNPLLWHIPRLKPESAGEVTAVPSVCTPTASWEWAWLPLRPHPQGCPSLNSPQSHPTRRGFIRILGPEEGSAETVLRFCHWPVGDSIGEGP